MAGHSQFKNIMYRKGAQDARRAKIFTKLGREIIVAARTGGADPSSNPRLRAAIVAARVQNMPKDKIENAIRKGSGDVDTDHFESVRYEGYGPGGAALIVEALTDNRNRTAAEIRSAFTKSGGSLGETGSVNFMFAQVGMLEYPASAAAEEAMFEAALEAGADNVDSDSAVHHVTCAVDAFSAVRDALAERFGDASSGKLGWVAQTTAPLDAEKAAALMKLMETLEDNDDVQTVYHNAELSDEVLAALAG